MTVAGTAPLRIGWCGPVGQGLGWLHEQLLAHAQVECLPAVCARSVEVILPRASHLQRLIIACPDRLSLSPTAFDRLQNRLPAMPLAIATSDWWNGAERTGWRSREYLLLPWYRWCDGWLPWLAGRPAELFDPLPHRLPFALETIGRHPSSGSPLETPTTGPAIPRLNVSGWKSRAAGADQLLASAHPTGVPPAAGSRWEGIIVAGSFEIAQAWLAAGKTCASASPDRVSICTARQFPHHLAEVGPPEWLLWDDSASDTQQEHQLVLAGSEFFKSAAQSCPGTLTLAALNMPRWDIWRQFVQAGARALLAKPATCSALAWGLAAGRSSQEVEHPGP